jgi:hypothetical protein
VEETMATCLPANEDYAKAVLSIFSSSHLRPGETLRAEQVSEAFRARNMGTADDYEDALKYAVDRGWLKLQFGMIRLTTVGFAQM